MKPEEKPDEVNEPSYAYKGKDIMIFNSIEEKNEHDYWEAAQLSPAESLSIVTRMRLRRHPYLNINLNPWGKEIYFDY
jgi:hypothetical protein